jgi:predicted ATPase/class 3 adenylate cyclase
MRGSPLPSGTVSFLFTDIEGSTRLLQEHGDGYAELLEDHRRRLRSAFERHHGVEVDTQGDSFFVAFVRAGDAVAAATEAQRGLSGGVVRVRMGIHTGEPLVVNDDYVGVDVHRAARIASAAHGGQIVLSDATRRLLADDLVVRDLGEWRLKDMGGAERLYQVGDGEFPRLRSLDATNLPIVASRLVGREREVRELVALVSGGPRLVTVTGPGGSGKTRLALQVTAELAGAYRDGVYWLPLSGLSDPQLVTSELGRVVGARDDVAAFLRDRELLVLLDNFEHLLDAAPAIGALLSAAPGIRLLVTSRSPLRVSAEREFRLEPLPTSDAAVLFIERAGAFGRALMRDATIEAICLRLDGLPLAVELAAARTKSLSPELLLARLDVTLPLLTGGARDVPERQRTLRATIEWSFGLLDAPNRELLERLAVFARSFPLTAAEEVCDADLDQLAALVDASLLRPIGDDRFLMLATIREFALEQLEHSADTAALRDRHAAFFTALADQAYRHRFDDEAAWAERLESSHDNLRAACDWLAVADPDRALALAGMLGWFWTTHGHLAEGHQRLTDALAGSPATGGAQARALTAAGALAARRGHVDEGRALLAAAIDLWRTLDDPGELAAALDALGWLLVYEAGDADGALAVFEESVEVNRGHDDRRAETRALVGVCQALVALGSIDRAEPLARDLLTATRGDLRTEHFAHTFLGDCALLRGDHDHADQRYREALRLVRPLGDLVEIGASIQGIAMAAAGRDDADRALRLLAAVDGLYESFGLWAETPFWDALLEQHAAAARTQLGAHADSVYAEGRAMTLDDAITLAVAPRAARDAPARCASP